ncbi:MAG TPA: hypothetical protein VEG68_17550 [Terriglobales bacterium]|nr:hypothetical protein [Terriglobales bacterium]
MDDFSEYWVFDWLRENDITSLDKAASFLPRYRVLESLRQLAGDAMSRRSTAGPPRQECIIAGGGLDLTGGRMVCPSPACLRRQVDKLVKHVWHYFDAVIADDVLTPLLTEEWRGSKRELVNEVLSHLAPMIYISEIGATRLVDFRPKTRCIEHWEENARAEGLGAILDSKDELIRRLIREANFSRRSMNRRHFYVMDFTEAGVAARIPVGKMSEQDGKLLLAGEAFAEYMVDLVADVSAAREYGLPLGSAQAFSAEMLKLSRPASVADVIFRLELPVLQGVSAAELIAIREANLDSFERFRSALRRAATEGLKANPGRSTVQAAEEIRKDIVEPELAKIKSTLACAEQVLVKKASVSIFLGVLATTCGILSGLAPALAVSAGVAATLAGVGPAALKNLDTEGEVRLSDMYFLWKGVGHSHEE